MTEFSKLLLYVPGIVIFLVGSAQVRDWISLLRRGGAARGIVLSCTHVVKKDKKDRFSLSCKIYREIIKYSSNIP